MSGHEYTTNWFSGVKGTWDLLIPRIVPHRILEIGCYEGASTCYLIDALSDVADVEIHCIDTWEGGIEHKEGGIIATNMSLVETRFHNNVKLSCDNAKNAPRMIIYKEYSDFSLAKLLSDGKRDYFDFIYIDGSHQAADVLCDAVIGFKLLKIGGVMAFDDYLWSENLPTGRDILRCPKPAIDAFVNINFRKLNVLSAPLYQLYVQKVAN
jgi:hypothetical protein